MVIDSHTHLYPEDAGVDPINWAKQRNEARWSACVAPSSGPILQGWSTPRKLLHDMDDARIDQVIILGWYWENPETCYEQNTFLAKVRAQAPDRLKVAASFNAHGQQNAIDDILKCFDSGFVGIGELNPPGQNYEYQDPWLDKALQLVGEQRKFANFHVTEPAGHSYPGKIETPFSKLQAMAKRHPGTTFIFAHLGGLLPFYELNRSAKKDLQNVFYDTAAVPLIYSKKVYRLLCDTIGAERILFGTDYPLRTFPKSQTVPCFKKHLESLRSCGLTEAERNQILGTNMALLLKQA